MFRQALSAVYTGVVELAEEPDATAVPPGVAAVIVPQPPTVEGRLTENAVVTAYRQKVTYPVTSLLPGAASPMLSTVEGVTTTGAHGVGFMSQKTLDEWMLRSAGAALVVALLRCRRPTSPHRPRPARLRATGCERRCHGATRRGHCA